MSPFLTALNVYRAARKAGAQVVISDPRAEKGIRIVRPEHPVAYTFNPVRCYARWLALVTLAGVAEARERAPCARYFEAWHARRRPISPKASAGGGASMAEKLATLKRSVMN